MSWESRLNAIVNSLEIYSKWVSFPGRIFKIHFVDSRNPDDDPYYIYYENQLWYQQLESELLLVSNETNEEKKEIEK